MGAYRAALADAHVGIMSDSCPGYSPILVSCLWVNAYDSADYDG